MTKRLKRHAAFIKLLYKASPSVRKSMLCSHCDKDFVACICDCARNILKGNVSLSAEQKNALCNCKTALRKLVQKKTSLSTKRKIIQKGGFLGFLLGPIVSVLGSLFNRGS